MRGAALATLEFERAALPADRCMHDGDSHGTTPGGRIETRQARGGIERLVGLIGRRLPAPGTGLWIEPCAAVHTFGVRGDIDLVFVSRQMIVQRIDAQVPPGRLRMSPGCRAVLELRAGEAARLGLRAGVRLQWRAIPEGVRR